MLDFDKLTLITDVTTTHAPPTLSLQRPPNQSSYFFSLLINLQLTLSLPPSHTLPLPSPSCGFPSPPRVLEFYSIRRVASLCDSTGFCGKVSYLSFFLGLEKSGLGSEKKKLRRRRRRVACWEYFIWFIDMDYSTWTATSLDLNANPLRLALSVSGPPVGGK